MVGCGPDTYDPVCELAVDQPPPCRSTAAIDERHLCRQIETARAARVVVGDTWEAKRRPGVLVHITGRHDIGTLMFDVRRNSSRRTQAISLDTLLRDYRLVPDAH